MKLFEYEAKDIIKNHGILIPSSGIARNAEEAEAIARKMSKPVVLKAQILVAGRGKAGGIVFADNSTEVKQLAHKLFGSNIKDSLVTKLLIEEKINITEQFYASVAIDRQAQSYVILFSTEGGVDIEDVVHSSPDKIARLVIDPLTGFNQAGTTAMLGKLNIKGGDAARLASIINTLYTVVLESDAELVEINPLAKTDSGEFVSADAKIIIDDNALFRHPEFQGKESERAGEYTPVEIAARKQGLAYVDLDGDIGIVGNGAGLVMATLDLVKYFGGEPANFLDIGGGGNIDVTRNGILLVMSKPKVKAIVLNVLGGITRCDIVAQSVIEALEQAPQKKPVVVRMMGTNEEKGKRMLDEAGISSYPNMEEAIEQVLKLRSRLS